MSSVPHLVQYQGSKRNLSSQILRFIPADSARIIEPFAGTAAVTMACAYNHIGDEYVINDLNEPLVELLKAVVEKPEYVASRYEKIWNGQIGNSLEHYYKIRDEFNKTKKPVLFLYLLARCVKGSVRYNLEGMFNQGPDKRRHGTLPATMRQNIFAISSMLKGKTIFYSRDYKSILVDAKREDIIYMDPPYQGVCGDRDARYVAGIDHTEFIEELEKLRERNISFIVSYDGTLGSKSYGHEIPAALGLKHFYLNAGRSSQATLLGRTDMTVESLYVTRNLADKVESAAQENQYELFARVS